MIFPIGARVSADTSAFVGSMAAATGGLRAFAGAAGLATTGLGVFVGAAGLGYAVSEASKFQAELTKMITLVGVSQDQVASWGEDIKQMSIEMGADAQDMARALYAIVGGGEAGSRAMEVLEQSVKASQLGMGDMQTISRTAVAALQAFGDTGLTAEKSIDIMVQTIRSGNIEADTLAGSLGRVMGIAASLGLEFEDLGAFMATYSRLGVDASVAATGLNAALSLLLKPQKEARDLMQELGIPVEHLRDVLREDGLNAALMEMKEAIGDDVDALGTVIPNVRALASVLGTVGVQSEAYADVQREIANSLGVTNEAHKVWKGTFEATMASFKANTESVAISVGELLLPPLTLLLEVLEPLIGLLNMAAQGWGMFFEAIDKHMLKEVRDFLDTIITAPEEAEKSFADLLAEVQKLDEVQLKNLEAQLSQRVIDLDSTIRAGIANEEEAIDLRDREAQKLAAVRMAIRALHDAERDLNDEGERTHRLTKEELEAEQERLTSIKQIVDAMDEELLRMREGEAAVLDKQLRELDASDATREHVKAVYEQIKALQEAANAEREAERAAEAASRARDRQRQRLREQNERDAQSIRDSVRRMEENEALARMNADMQEARAIAQAMAESIGQAFDDVANKTKTVSEAFGDMVTDILKQMQRLAIQKKIVEPLINALLGSLGPSSSPSASDFTSRSQELGRQLPGGNQGSLGFSAASLPADLMGAPNASVIVMQDIHFSPNLIDGRSGSRFLRENQGEIMTIIGEGVQRSSQFASALRG